MIKSSYVFISYSSQDQDYAHKLASQLQKRGFNVWIDKWRIRIGDDWWEEIVKGITECSTFVLIMTRKSQNSTWVQRELAKAHEHHKPILPLLRSGEIWKGLEHLQCQDVKPRGRFFAHEVPLDDFYNLLVDRCVIQQPAPGENVAPKITGTERADRYSAWIPGGMLVGLLLAGIIYGLTRSDTPPIQKHTLAASSTATILPTRTVETTVTAEAAPTQTPAAITAIPTDEPSALQNGFATLAFAPGMVAIRDTGIATFAINQIPVTHEAFQLYLQSHRGSITNDALQRLMDETEEGRPDAPMMNLTWAEARAYCQSQQKDLPRVEQWEAARLWLVSDIEEWVFTSGAPYLSLEPDGSVVEHDYDRPDSSIGFRCVTPLIN